MVYLYKYIFQIYEYLQVFVNSTHCSVHLLVSYRKWNSTNECRVATGNVCYPITTALLCISWLNQWHRFLQSMAWSIEKKPISFIHINTTHPTRTLAGILFICVNKKNEKIRQYWLFDGKRQAVENFIYPKLIHFRWHFDRVIHFYINWMCVGERGRHISMYLSSYLYMYLIWVSVSVSANILHCPIYFVAIEKFLSKYACAMYASI